MIIDKCQKITKSKYIYIYLSIAITEYPDAHQEFKQTMCMHCKDAECVEVCHMINNGKDVEIWPELWM